MSKVCVPICVRRIDEIRGALQSAAEVADMIELRLDCLDRIDNASEVLRQPLDAIGRPLILTLRSAEQGGRNQIEYESRRRFWASIESPPTACYFDIELDLVEGFARSPDQLRLDWSHVICSHHDFTDAPEQLDELYKLMTAAPAGILKIAVRADDAIDCLPIFRLLERACHEGGKLIAIAMGQAGVMTRILGPSRGSFLTYGSLDEESGTAPGQLTARELREVYRIDSINSQTEIAGLVGRPVAHSISPHIHNAAFANAGLNAVFIPFEVRDVKGFIRRMVRPSSREINWNLRGLSVTAPHKSAVIQHLHWIDPAAKDIGAVNTIVVQDDELHGYNTDAIGFINPLKSRVSVLQKLRCAVIGAGGAARAVGWALRNEQACVALFARNREKAKLLADQFEIDSYDLANADFGGFDIVVNATPLGTHGETETEPPAIAEQLRGVRLAYDLVYNPLETQFMREARRAGSETIGGLEMLICQAVEQFKLWSGREPDLASMRAAARNALARTVSAL